MHVVAQPRIIAREAIFFPIQDGIGEACEMRVNAPQIPHCAQQDAAMLGSAIRLIGVDGAIAGGGAQ